MAFASSRLCFVRVSKVGPVGDERWCVGEIKSIPHGMTGPRNGMPCRAVKVAQRSQRHCCYKLNDGSMASMAENARRKRI